MSVRLDFLDKLNHIGNMLGRLADNVRVADIKRVDVRHKSVSVEFRNVKNALVPLLGSLNHFVLAVVSVSSQMSNVGDVHNVLDVVAKIGQSFVENVKKNVCAQVSYVRVIVNCRAAAVKSDIFFIRVNWNKFFNLFSHCVEKFKRHIVLLIKSQRENLNFRFDF